jgi:beta-lactamase class A
VTRAGRARDLEGRLRSRFSRFRGDVGIYVKDVTSGVTFEHRAGELFPVSSVFKLFVLVHVFRRHEAGGLDLAERRQVPDGDISRLGPGVLKHLRGQPRLSVMDHCRLMSVWSDNVATDVLMQSEPPAAVNATLVSLGLGASRVAGTCTEMIYRMAGCDPATVSPASEREVARRLSRGELRNAGFADRSPAGTVSTPRELGTLCEALLRGEAAGPDASIRILGLLEDASAISRSMIPRFLPADVAIAHRAGGSWRVLADAGIVDVRGRPIVLAVCAYHEPGETGAADLLADVSRMIFDWFRAPAHLATRV